MKQELEQKPAWLELPADGVAEYWTTRGDYKKPKWSWLNPFKSRKVDESKIWTVVLYTAEDAEAASAGGFECGWVWDRDPAHKVRLSDVMRAARREGRAGVVLKTYGGKWIIVKRWPADVPLSGGDA